MAKTKRIYRIYEGRHGEPKIHWQYSGEPTVPGVSRDKNGYLQRPEPRWKVIATSAKQACWFVHKSTTSQSRDDGLGILSDARDEWEEE